MENSNLNQKVGCFKIFHYISKRVKQFVIKEIEKKSVTKSTKKH